MKFTVKNITTDFSVYAISSIGKKILIGGTNNKLLIYEENNFKELASHKKSIKCTASFQNIFGCGSYDCTATIFREGKLFDEVFGPETEIKGIAINEKYIALATRGKTVWVVKYDLEIEIDTVLEDHTQDIKGCCFNNNRLFTYSYDGTIKIYEKNDSLDSWELIQSIYEGNTVWDISFTNDHLVSANDDGYIRVYSMYDEYVLIREISASLYPIHSICTFKENICFILNRDHLCIIDLEGNILEKIEKMNEINCLNYSEEMNSILVGQNGSFKIINII
ncbi:hypothetical protein H312_02838 [Anncaliia algerae PRA339]|uniref:Uncharacterized protein n=1 Tax=Anncaliia algerae PRA339 TaxID=1288291 RepID=A0A059EXV2_9MICR|nr:hypothetical protein H312_02838 [Anncaliia algerae PRA339]